MPHAEKDTMGDRPVNGEMPQSRFINHIASYPIVSGSIEHLKTNPYGQKSLEIADQGYENIAKPIMPYLAKPYTYVAPYVTKADELGDEGLKSIDNTLPAVTETVVGLAYAPFRLAGDGKEYVLGTYTSERNAVGDGYLSRGRAAVSTGLKLTADSCLWLRGYLVPGKTEESKAVQNGQTKKGSRKN